MPTIERNKAVWGSDVKWIQQGEEWSGAWGGSEAQWFGAIYPRIRLFLPVESALEIAPGYGRFTHYLKEYCGRLIGVDLAENCVTFCRQRFADCPTVSFQANDGKSLSMVADNSLDFVFSFDSLVHAEADVLDAYLAQFAAKLKPDGVGFIHHSNLGAYREEMAAVQALSPKLRHRVLDRPYRSQTHWRAPSMTASMFEASCVRHGLFCIGQELVNWGTEGLLIDCFSIFTREGSCWTRVNRIVENPEFMSEARMIKRGAEIYSGKSFS